MPHLKPPTSTSEIVVSFTSWLQTNREEFLEDTTLHLLSTIENKWRGLLTQYFDYLLAKHNSALAKTTYSKYPEGKE